ncbi:MAG: hypothetical protein ACHRXM_26860 [Isosphaerales bacterium]
MSSRRHVSVVEQIRAAAAKRTVKRTSGEGHEKQRGYPWAHIEHDYGPDTFLALLEKYQYDAIYPPRPEHVGIIRLKPSIRT